MREYEILKRTLIKEIENNHIELLYLHEILVRYRDKGITKEEMQKLLDELCDIMPEQKDLFYDLMDFISGFCNTDLSLFKY